MTQGEVIGLIKAFGSSGGGGGGSAATVLECTVDANNVLTIPIKAGELASAMENSIYILKYSYTYNDGDNDHVLNVVDLLMSVGYEIGADYNFTSWATSSLYAETADDYPTATVA